MTEAVYDTAFVRRCATDETYRGELLSQAEFDRWLAHTKAEVLREMADAWYDDDSGAHWDDFPIVNDAPLLCRNSAEGRDWLRFHADRIERGER